MSEHDTYLLSIECGLCKEPRGRLNGYSSTKISRKKEYRYRKYRCVRRSNASACRMPMANADTVEHAALESLFDYLKNDPKLLDELKAAATRMSDQLQKALKLAEREASALSRQRDDTIRLMAQQNLVVEVRQALEQSLVEAQRKADAMAEYIAVIARGLTALEKQRRQIEQLLDLALNVHRWREMEIHVQLKHSLLKLIQRAVLKPEGKEQYRLWLTLRQ